MFLRELQKFIKPEIEVYCVKVMEDNGGAMKSANNSMSNYKTKHITVRHHFQRKHL